VRVHSMQDPEAADVQHEAELSIQQRFCNWT
jgi:hypothetical protein